jgi:uncharacterized membrane protein YbhN (UPF0104 family)
MNDKVVDGSLVVLGVLQIYSMFLPDVTTVSDSTPEIIHQEMLHASVAVIGLAAVACYLTRNLFPAYVALATSIVMIYMYEQALQRNCGCSGQEEY